MKNLKIERKDQHIVAGDASRSQFKWTTTRETTRLYFKTPLTRFSLRSI